MASIALENLTGYILDSIHSGVLVVDLASRVLFLNKEGASILEVTIQELEDKPLISIPRFVPFSALVNEHRKSGPSLTQSRKRQFTEIKTLGNSVRPLQVVVSNLVDGSDTVLGYVLSFQDRSEVEHWKNEAKSHQKMAALGTVAAGVAHEIRNPLHAIQSSMELIEFRLAKGGDISDYVEIVYSEVRRLDRLLEDILHFSRKPRLKKTLVQAKDLFLDSLGMVEISEDVEVEKDFQEIPGAMALDVDRIKQVLINLIRNSLQAMSEAPRLSLALRKRRVAALDESQSDVECVVFEVQDNGAGISEEDREKLFDPFFSRRRHGEGTGLGLAICQSLVEAHDGKIEVESQLEEGSVFRVVIPILRTLPSG